MRWVLSMARASEAGFHYRVRAENTRGHSGWCDAIELRMPKLPTRAGGTYHSVWINERGTLVSVRQNIWSWGFYSWHVGKRQHGARRGANDYGQCEVSGRTDVVRVIQERTEGVLSDDLPEFVQLVLFHGRTIIQPRGLFSQLVRSLPVFIMDPPWVFSGI